jgi:hypothetical protein
MLMMLLYWEKAYILSMKTLKVSSKEIGLEINVDKTKYVVMSRDQNAGRSQNIRIDIRSFERVEDI